MEIGLATTQEGASVAPLPRALTVRQFHNAIERVIGLNTLYEYARSGRLKSIRVGMTGRKLLIPRSEVDEFFRREVERN